MSAPESPSTTRWRTASGTSRGVPHAPPPQPAPRAARGSLPAPGALTGAVQYWDAQVDDARHTMTVVRTAVSFGALAANRVKVVGFLRQGERVTGARLVDLETGEPVDGPRQAGDQRDGRVD